jgi:hypothetical protein
VAPQPTHSDVHKNADIGEMSPEEANAELLMRTPSTLDMSEKSPKEKWQGLFRMYKEYKTQKAITDASSV